MTSLVLGAVGAVIGFVVSGYNPYGAAIGWSLGSALGGALDPQKSQGPRLADLKLQGSSYGSYIGIPYGTVRIAGDVIWQTDLEEHSHTEGGKGGPETTTFTYSASFTIQVCEGPISSFEGIWADGRLIYAVDANGQIQGGDLPVTFYLGTESQLPDPTMEAVEGVGNVSAHRGTALAVFTDLDLSDYGNRIPSFSFKVRTGSGDIPWRVSTFTPTTHPVQSIRGATLEDGVLTVAEYYTSGDSQYRRRSYLIDGTPTGTDVDFTIVSGYSSHTPCMNADICFATVAGHAERNAWLAEGVIAVMNFANPFGGVQADAAAGQSAVIGGALYAAGWDSGTHSGVARYELSDTGIPLGISSNHVSFSPAPNVADISFIISDDGFVWIKVVNGSSFDLYKYTDDLITLVHHWLPADLPVDMGEFSYGIYNGYLVYQSGESPAFARVYTVNDDDTFTLYGSLAQLKGPEIPLGGGLFLGIDGIISLNPPAVATLLKDIVADVSDRCGLDDKYDVDQLTDVVDGFVIGSQMNGRAAIESLMPVYFFDAVESDNLVKFVKRGGESVATIDVDELAAMPDGSTLPAPLETVRGADAELPAIVNIVYLNPDADYQNNTQTQRRQTGGSRSPVTVEVPIVLNDSKAKQVVDALLFNPWLERNRRSFRTTRKYLAIEPTDVVTVAGIELRITQKKEGADGVIQFEALPALSSIFSQPSVPGTAGGFTNPTIPVSQASQLYLLDIPLVEDDDLEGYYVAMAGATSSAWRGAALFKSNDGGSSYNQIARSTTADVIGTATTTLGDFLGGDIFDEINSLTVTIGAGGGTLSSSTELGVLNGANKALVGNEILQYRDAALVGASTYTLTGLLRGRRGTEWAIGTHGQSELFVVLPTSINIGSTELNVTRLFKAVTIGRTLAGASAVSFSNTGSAVRPYSVVQIGGGFDGAGNCTVNWTRRTRIGGEWLGYGEVPLSEDTERYSVEIWDSTFSTISATHEGLTTPTLTFVGSSPQYGKIYQNGRFLPSRGVRFRLPNNTVTWTSDLEPTPGAVPPISALREIPLNWATSGTLQAYSSDYGGFAQGDSIAVSFTTPAGTSASVGTIHIVEFVDGQVPRISALSLVSGDFDVGLVGQPFSKQESVGPNFHFTVGTAPPAGAVRLESSTTYYMNIRNGVTNAESCNFQVTLIKPTGL